MWRVVIYMTLMLWGLAESLRLHVPFFNDKGTPNPAEPFQIEQPAVSKAIYGRLGEGDDVAYFSFTSDEGFEPALTLLIPSEAYNNNGLRAQMRLFGSGLPEEGVVAPITEHFMKIVGHEYAMIQTYNDPLPQTGEYRVALERIAGKGTYCFCLGTTETPKIARALFTRVDEIIAIDA
jgi:hypothetical protein